jgi:hypothetical protein
MWCLVTHVARVQTSHTLPEALSAAVAYGVTAVSHSYEQQQNLAATMLFQLGSSTVLMSSYQGIGAHTLGQLLLLMASPAGCHAPFAASCLTAHRALFVAA